MTKSQLLIALMLVVFLLSVDMTAAKKKHDDDYECDPEKEECSEKISKKCKKGQFKNDDGKCEKCSQYCERCDNSDHCELCFPGTYMIRDKEYNAVCSAELPKGYIPDISNFELLNQDVLEGAELFKGYAVAVDGKKIISDRNEIPFTYDQDGTPLYNNKKIRLEAQPCQRQCRFCADGFVKNGHNNFCIEGTKCPWPLEETKQDGEKVCKDKNPDEFKAKIDVKQGKQKKFSKKDKKYKVKDPKKEELKRLTKQLYIITNKDQKLGVDLSYEWTVYKSKNDGKNLTPIESDKLFERQSNQSKKLKIMPGDLKPGNYKVKCLVSDGDSKVEAEYDLEIEERN